MNEPTMNVSGDMLMAIIGQKEVERLMLINRVSQLEAEVKALSPPPEAANVVQIKEPA